MGAGASKTKATLIGALAIPVWGLMFGLVRITTQGFGALLGVTLVYTLASVGLFFTRRPPSLRDFPKKYLLIGGFLFIFYEAAISYSIGLAATSTQTVEVSMVNYFWPTFTVLLGAYARGSMRSFVRALPGAIVATVGVMLAVGGDAGLNVARVVADVSSNPLPYMLTFMAAAAWAFYSVYTPRFSEGKDGVFVFMTGVAVVFWIMFAASGASFPAELPPAASCVALVCAAACIATGYACWNFGIMNGDMRKLSLCSYAAPFVSALASSLLLGVSLPALFWVGVIAVVTGSLSNALVASREG